MSIQQIPILAIGDYIANLFLPDTEGSVLATFSKVTYLRHAMDEVIWFVGEEASMHRRAIQLAGSLPELSVNTPYIVKNNALLLESGDFLDLSTAKTWKTPRLSPDNTLSIKDLKDHLDLCLSSLKELPSPAGFGIFIPELLDLAQDQTLTDTTNDLNLTTSQGYAWPIIKHITRACTTHDIEGIFEHGEDLIGLGEGLTPSGDDFMGGLLFCIRTLQNIYKSFPPSSFGKVVDFLEKSKSSTNLISYTLLKDHAYGHASETLHAFIHALFTGQDLESLGRHGSKLIQIGHSTGWDLLTGVLTGMLFTTDFKFQNTSRTHQSSSYYP